MAYNRALFIPQAAPSTGVPGGFPGAPVGQNGTTYSRLLFGDHFDGTSFDHWEGPGDLGTWRTSFHWGSNIAHNGPEGPGAYFNDGRGGINGEQQWYDDDVGDTFQLVTEQGLSCLQIKAQQRTRSTPRGSFNYTSGMINSMPKFMAQPPCWIEGRFKHSKGQGVWPAFWLYNVANTNDEFDLMEHSGAPVWTDNATRNEPVPPHAFTTMSIIGPPSGSYRNGYFKTDTRTFAAHGEPTPNIVPGIPTITDQTTDFYTISMEWRTDYVAHYFNRQLVWKYVLNGANDPANQTSGCLYIPNPAGGMYIIANLALNGAQVFQEFIGNINGAASQGFPAPWYLWCDYIVVYGEEQTGGGGGGEFPTLGSLYTTPGGTQMSLRFSEEFADESRGDRVWRPDINKYYFNKKRFIPHFWNQHVRTLEGNAEAQYYMDPDYGGNNPSSVPIASRPNPFEFKSLQEYPEGVLEIKAFDTPSSMWGNYWMGTQRHFTSGMLATMPNILDGQPYVPKAGPTEWGGAGTGYLSPNTAGYAVCRMKVPPNRGAWPAFWNLPDDTPDGYTFSAPVSDYWGREIPVEGFHPWPPEWDVVEFFGHRPTIYSSGFIGVSSAGDANYFNYFVKPFNITNDFHTWGIEWSMEGNFVKLFFDDALVATRTFPPSWRKPGRRFYWITNLAVGGNWYAEEMRAGRYAGGLIVTTPMPGINAWDVDTSTMPWSLLVDYIRCYELAVTPDPSDAGVSFFADADFGNDAWSGERSTPNATNTDGPVRTLTRARDLMRGSATRKQVYLRNRLGTPVSGTYRQLTPLSLNASDNNTKYKAFPNEKPRLVASELLTGWTNEGNGLYSKAVATRTMYDLFVDGVRFLPASKKAWNSNSLTATWYLADGGSGRNIMIWRASDTITSNDLAVGDAVHVANMERWDQTLAKVSAVNFSTRTITFADNGIHWAPTRASSFRILGRANHIVNFGEFGWRASDGRIVIKASQAPVNVEVPRSIHIFDIQGATNISFEDLDVRYTPSYRRDEAGAGWTVHAAFRMNGGSGHKLLNCTGRGIGNLLFGTSCHSGLVKGCDFSDFGAFGIKLDGCNDWVIDANEFTDVGVIDECSQVAEALHPKNITFTNNRCTNVAGSGISFGAYLTGKSFYGVIVNDNTFINSTTRIADFGPIYFSNFGNSDMRFLDGRRSECKRNWVEVGIGVYRTNDNADGWDVGNIFSIWGTNGIYLDEDAGDMDVIDNLVIMPAGRSCIYLHGGSNILVDNNFLIASSPLHPNPIFNGDNVEGVRVAATASGAVTSNFVVTHNVFYAIQGTRPDPWPPWMGRSGGVNQPWTINFNCVFNAGNGNTGGFAPADANSIFVDPLFVNRAAKNFHLAANSPARAIGIHDLAWMP